MNHPVVLQQVLNNVDKLRFIVEYIVVEIQVIRLVVIIAEDWNIEKIQIETLKCFLF